MFIVNNFYKSIITTISEKQLRQQLGELQFVCMRWKFQLRIHSPFGIKHANARRETNTGYKHCIEDVGGKISIIIDRQLYGTSTRNITRLSNSEI